MTAALRVIDTGIQPARWNVAMTAVLAELHGAGRIPDTLRFHVYPRCVLLGRHQELAEAVDAGFCRRNGIELARRVTGGGAVYMSPGVLAWDLVMPRRSLGGLDDEAERICGAVAAGLSRLGLSARFSRPNAIEIDGRKVSGASGYVEGKSLIHQGTVLIDVDFAEMAAALALPEEGLRDGLVTLRGVLGRASGMLEIKNAIRAGISEAFRQPLDDGEAAALERGLIATLYEELGSDAFVKGDEMAGASSAVRAMPMPFAQDCRP